MAESTVVQLGDFEKWFKTYLLNKTTSCLDRDILRWAKPVLKYGYEMQCLTDLEFKGSQVLLDAAHENAKLLDLLNKILEAVGKSTETNYYNHALVKEIQEIISSSSTTSEG